MEVASFTPRPLYPRYPLDRRLGGLHGRFERGGEKKKSLLLLGIEYRSSTS
jgi:hypothetical protein